VRFAVPFPRGEWRCEECQVSFRERALTERTRWQPRAACGGGLEEVEAWWHAAKETWRKSNPCCPRNKRLTILRRCRVFTEARCTHLSSVVCLFRLFVFLFVGFCCRSFECFAQLFAFLPVVFVWLVVCWLLFCLSLLVVLF
jgi:hypothetical protein